MRQNRGVTSTNNALVFEKLQRHPVLWTPNRGFGALRDGVNAPDWKALMWVGDVSPVGALSECGLMPNQLIYSEAWPRVTEVLGPGWVLALWT